MTSQTPEETHNTKECPYCHGHDCPECDVIPNTEGRLQSVEEYRNQILSEMNARRIDGKTYIDSNWLLSEYDKATLSVLVGEIESKRKLETWTVMTAPVVDEKAVAYNQALDQAIATITRTLRVE